MSTLPGKTVLVTGGLAANGYLTSVGPSGAIPYEVDHGAPR